jgi:hypothetical protein
MTTVFNATLKNVYFTEQCTCDSNFSAELSNHIQNVMIGSLNNWSKTAIEWNLATDANLGPHTTNGGCGVCWGGVMINSATSYTHYSSYYIVAQLSKVIKPGAVRIASTSTSTTLASVACINADSSRSLVVYNSGSSTSTFDVVWNGKSFPFTLAKNSVASFTWQGTTGVIEGTIAAQSAFANIRNFPEPFVSSTRIDFNLTKNTDANVVISDCNGKVVASLMQGMNEKGRHSITWNGMDAYGHTVPAGVYVIRFKAAGLSIAKRILKV